MLSFLLAFRRYRQAPSWFSFRQSQRPLFSTFVSIWNSCMCNKHSFQRVVHSHWTSFHSMCRSLNSFQLLDHQQIQILILFYTAVSKEARVTSQATKVHQCVLLCSNNYCDLLIELKNKRCHHCSVWMILIVFLLFFVKVLNINFVFFL